MGVYENLYFSAENGIGIITLNRPDSLNALNTALLLELSGVLDMIAKDSSFHAIIITGAGEKAFVSGGDITEMQTKTPMEAREFSQFGNKIMSKIEQLPQPVIAAVNGYALGGGCEIALACDIRIASKNARFAQPEVNLGIIAGFGGTQRLARIVGPGIAKELLMTGDLITAEQGREIGLVNHVVEQQEILDKAKEIASKIASKAQLAIKLSKKLVNEGLNMDLQRALSLESEGFGNLFSSKDQKEGMIAFVEKRLAIFKGE